MLFKDNLNRICREQGTTLTAMVKSLGISSSKATAINKGSLPSEEMLLKFAQALQCSVMDFFADEDEVVPVQATDADEEDILRIYRNLPRREKHEFMSMVYEFENRQELEGDKVDSAAI